MPANTAEFYFDASHRVYYSNKEPVPIADVIESLIGLEKLMRMTPKALSALTGVEIQRVDVFVEQVESGSLLEEIGVRLFFKDKVDLMKFVDKVREKVGDGPGRYVLIGAVMVAMVYIGADLIAGSKGGDTTNITANK